MNILVTGGAGFIGSHLVEELLKRKHTVQIIDDLSTGSINNILHLKENPEFFYTIDTIMNKNLMEELVDSSDLIFHLAAAVGVKLILQKPVQSISINIRGVDMLLEIASKKGKKVVIASTSEVYGIGDDIPFKESGNSNIGSTLNSRWGYACSKLTDEFLALAYKKEFGLPVVIARLFNVVGPRQSDRYGMVIPTFVGQSLTGSAITVHGDGKQTRSFCWVIDAVDALIKIGIDERCVGEIYNIGSDYECSILDLAKIIKRKTKSRSEIVFIPYEIAYGKGFEDMQRRVPDINKIKSHVGFEPSLDLDEIIDKIIEYKLGEMNIYKLEHYK